MLLREKWIERSVVGLNDNETYIHLGNFDSIRLQIVADFIVKRVTDYVSPQNEGDRFSCEYIGGQVISLPLWFLQIQGHQLESTLKNIFAQLKRFQQEPQLKREILLKVIDDIPALIPKDFVLLPDFSQTIKNQFT
ncbi:hypothetical protein [Nostoc sp.]|uniref:hypothetical protein n=1 Tax=Nostoc sp. TaxID=1180 RepID=UPI002FF76971